MGFLDGLGRFLRNEPVFPNEEASKLATPPVPVQETGPKQSPLVDEHGYKVIPKITLDRIKARRSGDTVMVTAWAQNHSDRVVRIDYFRVQGQKQVFQRELEPGKGHEVKIYDGPVASNEYDSHGALKFRIKDNQDEFENEYHVEFNREADGKFIIEELHEDGPVRDI
jgi:hypothetical protein